MDFVSAATGPSLMPDEPSYILLETSSGSDDPNADRERYSHASLVAPDTSRLERFLQPYIESEDILTAVVSYSKTQELSLWNIRETLPLCLRPTASQPMTFNYKYDVSLPVAQWKSFQDEVSKVIKSGGVRVLPHGVSHSEGYICMRTYCFGHAGDQNLHYNILMSYPAGTDASVQASVKRAVDEAVYSGVTKRNGSVSAEHGIGQQKLHILAQARSLPEMELMRSMKRQLDPLGIMNPGKVIQV